MAATLDPLLAALAEISDLGRARALLRMGRADEDAAARRRGARRADRDADQAARTCGSARISSACLLDEAAGGLDSAPHDSFEASLVRVARREWEKARRVPAELRAETARVSSIAEHAWEQARERSDFAAFLPHLERVIELKRRYVDCFDAEHPYDPLLDDFEPGMRTAELEPVLAAVRDGTVELLAEIAARPQTVDYSCLYGDFPVDRQADLAREVAGRLPLERGAWRIDETVHPFAARDRDLGPADHDPIRPAIRRHLALGGDPRGRSRAVSERARARARTDAALPLGRRSASTNRRAGCGRTGSVAGARSSPTCARCSPRPSRSGSRGSTPRPSTARRTGSSPR